jgi:membrane protease YdiL (CAAX protease family)
MNKQKLNIAIPFVMWVASIIPLWLASVLTGTLYYVVALCVTSYMIVVPLLMIRYFEKESIVQRLGMQSGKFLLCVLLAFTSVLAVITVTTVEWIAFLTVVLAPIPEEMFFRGYIMGRFLNSEKISINLKAMIGLVLSSLVFCISHAFHGYSITLFFGIFLVSLTLFGFIYWITGSILLSAAIHTTFNFLQSPLTPQSHSVFLLCFLIGLIIVPSASLSIWEFVKRWLAYATSRLYSLDFRGFIL